MSHSLNLSRRFVLNAFYSALILWVLSACGQKGDLYLPNIPPSPNVINNGQEAEQAATNEVLIEQDESSETKKGKDKDVRSSKEDLPATVTK